MTSSLLSSLVVAAGTYDGVLAGWEFTSKDEELKLVFATAVHDGSVRSLSLADSPSGDAPGSLLSCGYDETLRTHDWHKRLTSSGEVRTPPDFGTPVCSSFAPPVSHATHCIIGFSNGKLAIYKKRDWSVQHVLAGHEGGVASLAVHPSGKLALTGGLSDGKIKLWDLTKGRLAFVNNITPDSSRTGKLRHNAVVTLVWSPDGDFYAFAHGSHVTVRDASSGKDLLDVSLPSRVNQVTLMNGPMGLYLAAACNDGSLPVLAVEDSDDESRRAIMAIEPVESVVAGEERFKCITCISGYYVVTANSAGVISLMNLEGAVKMTLDDEESSNDENQASGSEDSDKESEELDLAVDIIHSVRLGTGARVTCLTAWAKDVDAGDDGVDSEGVKTKEKELAADNNETDSKETKTSLKRKQTSGEIVMDSAAVEKARDLVNKAKKMKKRKERKKRKKNPVE